MPREFCLVALSYCYPLFSGFGPPPESSSALTHAFQPVFIRKITVAAPSTIFTISLNFLRLNQFFAQFVYKVTI